MTNILSGLVVAFLVLAVFFATVFMLNYIVNLDKSKDCFNSGGRAVQVAGYVHCYE